jgi:hypothetical protein
MVGSVRARIPAARPALKGAALAVGRIALVVLALALLVAVLAVPVAATNPRTTNQADVRVVERSPGTASETVPVKSRHGETVESTARLIGPLQPTTDHATSEMRVPMDRALVCGAGTKAAADGPAPSRLSVQEYSAASGPGPERNRAVASGAEKQREPARVSQPAAPRTDGSSGLPVTGSLLIVSVLVNGLLGAVVVVRRFESAPLARVAETVRDAVGSFDPPWRDQGDVLVPADPSLSDREMVRRMLAAADGRLYQSEIVERTD